MYGCHVFSVTDLIGAHCQKTWDPKCAVNCYRQSLKRFLCLQY